MRLDRRVLLAAMLLSGPALAHDYTQGALFIGHPWTRAAGAGGTGAGYLSIRNDGTAPDSLIGASTPAARAVELHTMLREGEVMRMRPVTEIALPPGRIVALAPGGLHIMLIGLAAPLVLGTEVPLTLRFAQAGEVTVQLRVQAAGTRQHVH